jgi:hypothetical protein
MNANRKIAVIVGALFVSGLILFVLSRVLTESILSLPDYLTMISAKGNRVLIGGLQSQLYQFCCTQYLRG